MTWAAAAIALGFAIILMRSMIDRGAARSFVDDGASQDWSYEMQPGGAGRILRFFAGYPCLIVLLYLAFDAFGWRGLALFPAGIAIAFLASVLYGVAAGQVYRDRVRFAAAMRRTGRWLPLVTVAWVIILFPIVSGLAEGGRLP